MILENSFLVLLIAVLSVYRLSILLINESGPFDIFVKLRMWALNRGPNSFLAQLLSCIYCISVWVSIGVAIGLVFIPHFVFVLLPFALSMSAIMLFMWLED
jgi:hypothetical protein